MHTCLACMVAHRVGELMSTTAPCLLYNTVHTPGTYMSAHVVLARPLLINLQPRKKEKKKKRKRGRSCTCKWKGFYLLLVTFATLIYVLSDSFNFGHFHACMHEGLLLQRFTPHSTRLQAHYWSIDAYIASTMPLLATTASRDTVPYDTCNCAAGIREWHASRVLTPDTRG